MKRILLLVFLASSFAGFSQTSDFPIGARSAGMANASVALTDLWAIHHNQAAMVGLEQAGVAAYYENRFLLSNLNLQAATAVLPTPKAGVFGISFSRFGNQLFNQSRYGLAYGKKLWDFLSVGLQLSYLNTTLAEGYGTRHSFIGEIGLLSQVTPKFRLGFHAFNLTRTRLTDDFDERLPMNFRLGAQYDFSKKVKVAVEAEKDLELPPVFKTGVEYFPADVFAIRVGVATSPFRADFGLGLRLKFLHFDIAGSIHPVLGFSPKASLSYRFDVFKNKRK
jgi:predicted porin